MLICIGLPIFVMAFYLAKIDSWEDESFQKSYGAILEDLDTNPCPTKRGHSAKWAIIFPMILILRRGVFTVAIMG